MTLVADASKPFQALVSIGFKDETVDMKNDEKKCKHEFWLILESAVDCSYQAQRSHRPIEDAESGIRILIVQDLKVFQKLSRNRRNLG
jgi:hypothetical protein